jgi:DNA repair exonuclease SbcCD ATPase subunit
MDERKKSIAGLENKKQETLRSLDLLLEALGRRILERAGAGDFFSAATEEYRRLHTEAADLEKAVKTIEEDSLRIQTLDEKIEAAEEERAAGSGELSGLYRNLGREIIGDPQYGDLAIFYRQRTDALGPKIEALEARLAELDAKDGSGVFTWIGKSAQILVNRFTLARAREDLEKLHEAAGEQFSRPGDTEPALVGKAGLLGDIEKARSRTLILAEKLAGLREERRRLAAETGAGGGPARRIRGLEKRAGEIRQELKTVCRRFGEAAAEPGNKKRFAALMDGEDRQGLEKIALIRKTVRDYDGELEKLRASLAVDDAKEEIRKLEKAVTEQRDRIAAAEGAIAEYTQKIREAQARIEELAKLIK